LGSSRFRDFAVERLITGVRAYDVEKSILKLNRHGRSIIWAAKKSSDREADRLIIDSELDENGCR